MAGVRVGEADNPGPGAWAVSDSALLAYVLQQSRLPPAMRAHWLAPLPHTEDERAAREATLRNGGLDIGGYVWRVTAAPEGAQMGDEEGAVGQGMRAALRRDAQALPLAYDAYTGCVAQVRALGSKVPDWLGGAGGGADSGASAASPHSRGLARFCAYALALYVGGEVRLLEALHRQIRQLVTVARFSTVSAMGVCGERTSSLPMPPSVRWDALWRVSLSVANEVATAALPRTVPCVPDDPGEGAPGGAGRARDLIMEDGALVRDPPTPELMAIQLWGGSGPSEALPWEVVTNVPVSAVHDLMAATLVDLTVPEAKIIADALEPVLDALPGLTEGPAIKAADVKKAISLSARRGAPDPCGWRMDHYRAMASGGAGSRFGDQIARFLTWVYDGEQPAEPERAAVVEPIAKLFMLVPRWLLTGLSSKPSTARRAEIERRAGALRRGEWAELHSAGCAADTEARCKPVLPADPIRQCRAAVAAGNLSRGMGALRDAATSLPMAGSPSAFPDAVRRRAGLLHPQDGEEGYGEAPLPFNLGKQARTFMGGRLAALSKGNAEGARRESLAPATEAAWVAAEAGRVDDIRSNPARVEQWNVRPTVTGPVIRRLASKAILLRHGKSVGAKLLRNGQFAVAVSGGADIFGHAARVAYASDPGCALVELDFTNAFNQVRRGKIAQGLQAVAPQLKRMFNLHYATDSVLRTRDGAALLSHIGVQQGDGLGTFFFCVGIDPLLGALRTMFPGCTVLAWSDNIVGAGPVEALSGMVRWVTANVREYFHEPADGRPILNAAHSSVLCESKTLAELNVLFPGYPARGSDTPPVARGSKILGSPVGTDEFVRAWLEGHLEALVGVGATWEEARAAKDSTARDCALLRHLGAEANQDAEVLLEYCSQVRLTHLWRVVPPAIAMEFAGRVQVMLHGAVGDILDLDFAAGSAASVVVSLPRRGGGKGYQACHQEHAQSSFASSVARFLRCVVAEGCLPNLLPAAAVMERVMRAELDEGTGEVEAEASAQSQPGLLAGGEGGYATALVDCARYVRELGSWAHGSGGTGAGEGELTLRELLKRADRGGGAVTTAPIRVPRTVDNLMQRSVSGSCQQDMVTAAAARQFGLMLRSLPDETARQRARDYTVRGACMYCGQVPSAEHLRWGQEDYRWASAWHMHLESEHVDMLGADAGMERVCNCGTVLAGRQREHCMLATGAKCGHLHTTKRHNRALDGVIAMGEDSGRVMTAAPATAGLIRAVWDRGSNVGRPEVDVIGSSTTVAPSKFAADVGITAVLSAAKVADGEARGADRCRRCAGTSVCACSDDLLGGRHVGLGAMSALKEAKYTEACAEAGYQFFPAILSSHGALSNGVTELINHVCPQRDVDAAQWWKEDASWQTDSQREYFARQIAMGAIKGSVDLMRKSREMSSQRVATAASAAEGARVVAGVAPPVAAAAAVVGGGGGERGAGGGAGDAPA